MQQSKYRPCVRVSREVFSCAATKEMAAGLQGSFKTSWLEAGQHEEAEGDGTHTLHSTASASFRAQELPSKGEKKKKSPFYFCSDMGSPPSPPPLLSRPTALAAASFARVNQHEMNVERQSGTVITYYFQVICFISA